MPRQAEAATASRCPDPDSAKKALGERREIEARSTVFLTNRIQSVGDHSKVATKGGSIHFTIFVRPVLPSRQMSRPMRAVIVLVTLCFVAVAIALFLDKTQTIKVTQVKKESTITLNAPPKAKQIHGISLRIFGNLKGSATVSIGDRPAEKIEDSFDLKYDGDWYSLTCDVHYTPIEVETGSLSIQYEFRE